MTLEEYARQALETRQQWINGEMSHEEYVNLANAHVVELATALRKLLSGLKTNIVSCCAECPFFFSGTSSRRPYHHCCVEDVSLSQNEIMDHRKRRPVWCPLPITVKAEEE